VVISGAIQGKGTVQENGVERFSEETWEYLGGQMERYFKGMSIVGWVHCQPGFGAFLMAKDENFHREYFKENGRYCLYWIRWTSWIRFIFTTRKRRDCGRQKGTLSIMTRIGKCRNTCWKTAW
ncbi:MAG: hypothetical protein IKL30_02655, partial [Anaerotignum sp.]|nr:hypothetical protein [Anaerotignum sp.]